MKSGNKNASSKNVNNKSVNSNKNINSKNVSNNTSNKNISKNSHNASNKSISKNSYNASNNNNKSSKNITNNESIKLSDTNDIVKRKKVINRNKLIVAIGALVILCIILLCVLLSSISNNDSSSSNNTTEQTVVSIVNEIEGYDYSLTDSDSEYVVELFHELEGVLLNVDNNDYNEEDYVTLIAKIFIADFFTLDNKFSNVDIGGIDYVDPLIKENFSLKVSDTLYKYIELDWGGASDQVLPVVKDVEVLSINTEYISYNDDLYYDDYGYIVEISWTYVEDLGYQDSAILKFVHNDHKIDLVEISEI